MRVVVQRVNRASVSVDNKITGEINCGLCVLLGIEQNDSDADLHWLAEKVYGLRIFRDENGAMNLSVLDVGGGILVISQFTLFASTKKGNRPSFLRSAKPETAKKMVDDFITYLGKISGLAIETGIFGADMKVEIINDGPVTIVIDTQNKE